MPGGHRDAGVRRAVVQAQFTGFEVDQSAGEHHAGDVADLLVRLGRTEHPLVAPFDQPAGVVQVEQGQPDPVQLAGHVRCTPW